jgi:aryl-alcohol dehydrogenase-like predicted oxidoreductase
MTIPLRSALEAPWLAPREPGAKVRLALGTMNFGKRTSEAEAERILARAIERGVALLDTANVYNDGASERIVGRALGERRASLLVATKVGLARVSGRAEGLSRAAVSRAVEASLRRLGTDYIDLYYLHAPDPETPIEETLDAIAELLQKKRILHFGVSNYASWQVLEIMHLCDARGIERPRVSQVIYNLLIRQVEIEYLRFARRYPIHTTVYNPVAGGLLAGRYKPGDSVAEGSRFDKNQLYQRRYWSPRMLEAAEQYRALGAEAGMSLLELAYAWLAGAPGVDSILVGPATVEHLDAAIDACERPLSPEVRAKAEEIHKAYTGTDASYAR